MNGAKIQQRALTAPRSRSPGRGGAVGIRTTSESRPSTVSVARVYIRRGGRCIRWTCSRARERLIGGRRESGLGGDLVPVGAGR